MTLESTLISSGTVIIGILFIIIGFVFLYIFFRKRSEFKNRFLFYALILNPGLMNIFIGITAIAYIGGKTVFYYTSALLMVTSTLLGFLLLNIYFAQWFSQRKRKRVAK
jgi:hypothetical protein